MNRKTCYDCKIEYSVDNFYRSGNYYQSYCKECEKKKTSNYNKNNVKYNEYQKKYHSSPEYKQYQKEYQKKYNSRN